MAGQYERQSTELRLLSCARVGALRFGQEFLEQLAQSEMRRQNVSRKLVTWRDTPFAILATRVLSTFDVKETDQEARLCNFAVAVENYTRFYAFLQKNNRINLSKPSYKQRYDIGEKLLEAFLLAHPALAALSPTQSGDILVVERQDAMEAFEEWARDNYGHMTLTDLEVEFGITSAEELESRAARASRETVAREADMAQREAAQVRQQADLDRRAAELARAELAQRVAVPARVEVPQVESDSGSDFEPEPPKRSEKKRKRTSTSGGGDDGQGAAKRRCALENKTFNTAFRWFSMTVLPAAGVYGLYAFSQLK
jgi:hypothetical protein